MNSKRLITGLKNSQSIRVIIQGVAVFMKVKDVPVSFAFPDQRSVVMLSLEHLGTQRLRSFGRTYQVYDDQMKMKTVDIQVDLA
jgi:hypothetical protein